MLRRRYATLRLSVPGVRDPRSGNRGRPDPRRPGSCAKASHAPRRRRVTCGAKASRAHIVQTREWMRGVRDLGHRLAGLHAADKCAPQVHRPLGTRRPPLRQHTGCARSAVYCWFTAAGVVCACVRVCVHAALYAAGSLLLPSLVCSMLRGTTWTASISAVHAVEPRAAASRDWSEHAVAAARHTRVCSCLLAGTSNVF
jgi:hypothetical protein